MVTSFSLFFFFFVFFLLRPSPLDASQLRYDLEEELPAETVVGNVKLDISTRSNYSDVTLSRLRYRFQGPCDHFRLDGVTGTIRIRSRVDRDVICRHDDADAEPCVIDCYVIVESPEFYDVVAVAYVIGDVNDNAPQFPADAERRLEVSESVPVGTRLLLPTADDPDSVPFGVRSYVLDGGGGQANDDVPVPFELDYSAEPVNELRLRVTGPLDREQVPRYALRVAAVDGGDPVPRTGALDLQIVVRDENDNPPRLTGGENKEATLEENLPIGTRILQVTADDPDEGRNGNLTFSFADDTMTSHGDVFGINGRDGWIHVTGVVDYERDRSLVLTIVVADEGIMALTSYAKVAIYVSDVNDNDPVIVVSSFQDRRSAEVHENRLPGTFVAHIEANDADGGDNGRVTCSIDNPRFRLVATSTDPPPSEYQLVSAVVFDREERPQEALAMSCTDRGQPSRSVSVMVNVWIVDENDNAPKFHDDDDDDVIRVVRLRENNVIGATVTSYNVTDPDDGRNAVVDLSIEATGESSHPGAVVVDVHGVVAANLVFDYEQRRRYSFRVVAADRGVPSLSGSVQLDVEIEDVNDEPPTFEVDSYVFRTRENRVPGTPVGRVRAFDNDASPEFRRIWYSFAEDQRHLSIDPDTGEIVVVRPIDREIQSSVTFKVRASNDPDFRSTGTTPLSSDVNVMLFVEDENDNAPVMTFPSPLNQTVTLRRREVKAGDRVGRIEAFDLDEGTNAELAFSATTTTSTSGTLFFDVEASTGWIVVSDDYDKDAFLEMGGRVRLFVSVSDRGRPPRRSAVETLVLAARDHREEDEGPVELYAWNGLVAASGTVLITVGVGCGLLAVVVVLAVTLICRRIRSFKVKNRHSYNCRLAASRATTSSGSYRNRRRGTSVGGLSSTGNGSRLNGGTGKKGVRFNLDGERGPSISSPITECKLACPFPDECAFHRHGIIPPSDGSSQSSADGPPNVGDPVDGPLANGSPLYGARHEPLARRQRQTQPSAIANPQQRSLRKVGIPSVDQIMKFGRSNVHQTDGEHIAASSSYPVGCRPSSVPEHWSNGSLPHGGRCPSDAEESGVLYSGSQEPFFPAESNV